MSRFPRLATFTLACVLLPALAFAQGSIAGSVKDATGALLPGVTVEAASPALIEKVRSVVSDGAGRFLISDLRPGVYSVTFTLPGFSTFKRDGIELTGSFIATVDAEMRLGAVEETITVSGQAPVVDVQSASLQRVISKEVLDSIPAGRGQSALAVLIPGMSAGGQDVGGSNNQTLSSISIHGGRGTDQRQSVDGITMRNVAGQGNSTNTVIDVGSSQEMTIDYAAGNAESVTGGVLFNFVPKEGGNNFSGSFFGSQTNTSFQGSNYSPELAAQGLRSPNRLKNLFDHNASFGGPIRQDKLWFYSSARFQRSENYIAGLWENKNAGDLTKWLYEADLDRQTSSFLKSNTVNSRVTWQASARNKFNVYFDNSWRYWNSSLVGVSSESEQKYDFPRLWTVTGGWSSPVSNRLLIDVRTGIHKEDIFNFYSDDPNHPYRNLVGVVEQNQMVPIGPNGELVSIGQMRYRGRANTNDTGIAANDQILTDTFEIKGSVSYITGSHALKVGVTNFHGIQTYNSPELNNAYNIRTNNGVPNQITQRQNQYMGIKGGARAELGAFVQDRWTINRLTVNAGLRYEYNLTGWDEYTFGPAPLVPNRNFTIPGHDFYKFHDLQPRLGAAYDLFGTGRTAVKVNLGRYGLALLPTEGVLARDRIVGRVTRAWTDADRDFIPDCDLINLFAQDNRSSGGDFCGQVSDLRFGTPTPSQNYDPSILSGWHNRQYNWEFSTSVQHEVVRGLGVDVGYFRRAYGNFVVTQNRAVTRADYTEYSIPVPVDPRLPNSGQTLGGLFNVNPNKFGQVDNLVTSANNFGGQSEVFNGVDINANARLGTVTLRGGISTGKVTQDTCAIRQNHPEVSVSTTVGNVQSYTMCHVEQPFLTQAKLFAIYNVPRAGVGIAATLQNLPGPMFSANYIATNAVIAPSLGRPLAGNAPNTTINLVQPGTMYGERLNQLDVRLTKDFRFGGARLFRANLDIYNVLNSNPVRGVNANYASWLIPTSILDPRLFKISAQFDF